MGREIIISGILTFTFLPVIFFALLILNGFGLYNAGYHGGNLFTITPLASAALAVALRIWIRLKSRAKAD